MRTFAQSKWQHAERRGSRDPRLIALMVVGVLVWAALIVRLFMVQVLHGAWYEGLASGQRELFQRLYPERGEVLVRDRRHPDGWFPVATNRQTFTIYAVPTAIDRPKDIAGQLAPILALDEEAEIALATRLAKPNDPYEPIVRSVSQDLRDAVLALGLPGIAAEPTLTRYYPDGPATAHLTGFVGEDEHGVSGRYGIEGSFEQALAGTTGALAAERDPRGRWIAFGRREVTPARDGADLRLTIERELQLETCRQLAAAVEQHGASGGTVVIVHPRTGAIRALCSVPTFDPNAYAEVTDLAQFQATAVSGAYEPGSVFKAITLSGAIEHEVVTPSTTYRDEGFVELGGFRITNSNQRVYGEASMTDVLKKSINTGSVFAAKRLGMDRFRSVVEQFGFGTLTDIELAGEVPGDVSNLARREEVYLGTASYGQGMTVTPLQLAVAYAVIANGGELLRPYLVEEVIEPDGTRRRTEPRVIRRVLSTRTATLMQGMLVAVVRDGYPKLAGVPGYLMGGKTGTAEIPYGDRPGYSSDTIHTFAGIGAIDQPTFAMVVRFDRPQRRFADATAAPLFGQLARFILQHDGIPPRRDR